MSKPTDMPDSPRALMQFAARIVSPPPSKSRVGAAVGDRLQPASKRIEAVEGLASECLEHWVFHILCGIICDESDDVAVRSAIVRVLPRWATVPCK